MKIIIVHNSYREHGGEDVAVDQEIELLRRNRHEVVVYRRSNAEVQGFSPFRAWGLAKRVVWAEDSRRDIERLIRRERPDVVHVHNTFFMISPSIYSACRDCGIPVVQTLHNYRLLCPGANLLRDGHVCEDCIQKSLLHSVAHGCYRSSRPYTAMTALMLSVHRARQTWSLMVDSYIALTQFAARKLVAGGLPASRMSVKPNFVSPDPGVRDSAGEYALYVGRLSEEKGIDVLLHAWKRVRANIPLLVIGDGPLGQKLKSEFAKDKRIKFCGALPRVDVLSALKRALFLVVPSRCYETFSISIAEAYACGVPVLASDTGAMQELIEDQRTGLLFEPGNSTNLAEVAEWAWSNPARLATMGNECRAEFELKYNAGRNYRLLLSIYERVVSLEPAALAA